MSFEEDLEGGSISLRQKQRRRAQETLQDYLQNQRPDLLGCEMSRSAEGRPFLVGVNDFFFSVSHTDGFSVLIVSDSSIAIDIETLKEKTPESFKSLLARIVSPHFATTLWDGQTISFYRIWTAHEALVKERGRSVFHRILQDEEAKKIQEEAASLKICGSIDLKPLHETPQPSIIGYTASRRVEDA